jgi:hypothetical protein
MKFWYSEKQDKFLNKVNYVEVNGEMKPYTEITHDKDSGYKDAVLVIESEEYPKIELGIENLIDAELYDDEPFYPEDIY